MDLLEKYMTEIKQELYIDEMNIGEVQRRLPSRRHLWVGRLIRHKQEREHLKREMIDIKKKAADKIKSASITRLTNGEAFAMASNTSEVADMKTKLDELELIIEFLEKTEKNLTSMVWDIKNIIEIQKLEML